MGGVRLGGTREELWIQKSACLIVKVSDINACNWKCGIQLPTSITLCVSKDMQCMYVCMYVYMYVCMYVCLCVCV